VHARVPVLGIADLDVNRVRKLAERLGWPEERTEAKSLADALRSGGTFLTEDADVLIAGDGVDVIVEATGNSAAGIQHALACLGHKRHIVMVNVEADVLAGPMLARRAAEADVLYSGRSSRHCRPGATAVIETSRGRHTSAAKPPRRIRRGLESSPR
jgi:predicted homoserine dehydrogenase-like protein